MVRIAQERDVPQLLAIYAPYILTTTVTFEYDVPSEAEFLQRFRSITARFPWLVWEEDGTVFGYAYASAPFERAAYAWCSEASVYLAPQAQGRGIGKKLYAALEAILKYQGFCVVYAIITSENAPSVAFHRKMGYKYIGFFENSGYKFSRWLGVTWMEKRLNPVENVSNSPQSWSLIRQNGQKFSDILDILSLS